MRPPSYALSLVAVLTLMAVKVIDATASVPDFYTGRMRTNDSYLYDLLEEGYGKSSTFAHIVDQIQRTDGIVYIEKGGCGRASSSHACLLHQMVVAGGTRFLRIHIDVSHERRIEIIARMAHELQHACEVLEVPWVRSEKAMRSLFLHIGLQLSDRDRALETLAAVQVGRDVLTELESANSRPPK